jgi:hypothetical protein
MTKIPDRNQELLSRPEALFGLSYSEVLCRHRLAGGENMSKLVWLAIIVSVSATSAMCADRPARFWNLTRHTISEFYLAPAGTTNWSTNQTKNDKDGTVDSDERLRITGVDNGTYDAKLKDISGRTCIVRNIKLTAGEIFSIEEKDLSSCDK